MKNKTTTELLRELVNFNTFEEYEIANKDYMLSKNLSEYLNELIKEKNLTKAEIIKKSQLNENYAYQLLSGLKANPKRDKLICLCMGMELSVEETNSILKIAGLSPLYPRIKRDSVIILAVNNKEAVVKLNENLFELGEETLN